MKADQGNNLSEMVYHYLLDMILSMKIKPGDRIPEARIATQFVCWIHIGLTTAVIQHSLQN